MCRAKIIDGVHITAASAAVINCFVFLGNTVAEKYGVDAAISGLISAFLTICVDKYGVDCTQDTLLRTAEELPRQAIRKAKGRA